MSLILRERSREEITLVLIGLMTRQILSDLKGGLSTVLDDREIEGVLIHAMKDIPVGNILTVCFLPFVSKLIRPRLDSLSMDDLVAIYIKWIGGRPAKDYEPCGECGFDHSYEPQEAAEAHKNG